MAARLIAILCLIAGQACAQDVNYWSSNYDPGGFLTPGATIANNGDSGVFFYNPALFAYSRKSSTSISGTIYQYQSIHIADGAGTGLPLNSFGGSVIPQMASNTISLKLKKPFTVAYAILHEPIMTFTATQRKDALLNALSDSYSPGPETFVGQYTLQNNIDETAGILSGGFKLGPRLAAGLSAEGRIRKQTYSTNINARAVFNTSTDTVFPPIASAESYYLNTYTHIGFRVKAGLAFDAGDRDHLGLLISSPLVHIAGSSTIVADNQISNIKDATTFTFYFLATTRQTNLPARFKIPLSIALGYTHDFGNSQLFFSAEYFSKLKEYNIVTPRNGAFIRPADSIANTNTADLIKLKDAHRAILNLAVGYSQQLTAAVTGFLSFRTDFNYATPSAFKDDYNNAYISNTASWDLYHVQAGANFRRRKFNLRVGLLLEYGHTSAYPQQVNFDNPNENNILLGDTHPTKATRLSGGLLFSYIHNL